MSTSTEPQPPPPARIRPAARWPVLLGILADLLGQPELNAATTIRFGTVRTVTGAASLDLDGEFVYAINFSADDPVRVLRSVTFVPDTQVIPGATLVGPQQAVGWQNRPEFGTGGDDNQLEGILHDIRWANSGAGERLRATLAVQPGEEYQLQILISANGPEDRRWDIRVDGREAVDEITSLGVAPGQTYARNQATVYTCQFAATNDTLVVEMGDLFGANDGGDRNPLWQALTLERITSPPAPDDVLLEPTQFFPLQPTPIGRFRAVDRRSFTTHAFTLVPGNGDQDNAKFIVTNADLARGDFDFTTAPAGSTFSVRVRATDVGDARRFLERAFTITLREPHPPARLRLDAASMAAGAVPGALVARVAVDDVDTFDTHALALAAGAGDTDNARFVLNGAELHLASALPADQRSVSVRLRATDLGGLSRETAFLLPVEIARVRINEVLAAELPGAVDATVDSQEWIELLNERSHYVDLAGWSLTDDREVPGKWRFPSRTLPPAGFLVILADGRDTTVAGSTNLHAPFSLSADGEWLGLFRPDGNEPVSTLDFPRQFPSVAYGIGSDGQAGYLPHPTPWSPNGSVAPAGENAVHFSRPHGFYTNAFPLELAADLPDSTVRYTLDGTAPTATSGTVYTSPITITPNTTGITRGSRVVRAIAVHPQAVYTPIATQTYLFVDGVNGPGADGIVGQSRLVTSITRNAVYGPLLSDAFRALPAVSVVLSGAPDTTERRASIELLDPQANEPGFQIDCGLEATGTSSLGSPKLSLAARFRTEYGKSRLRYPVFARGSMFPDRAADTFRELRLRSHSHDTFYWLGTRENPPVPYGNPAVTRSADAQLVRNPWIDEMQLAMGQPGKHGRQVHLFLNGSYHGIYHVHEHADEDFMASYYPGPREDYHFTGATTGGSVHGAQDTWRTPWTSLKASLGDYAQAKRWIDVTNLCDYMILSFYAGNDWDWTAQHNWSAAGPRLPDRGGWKFFQQDSDVSLQDVAADCTDQDVPDGIFTALMRHADFRVLFRDRVQHHCFGDGILTPARAAALYDARMNEIHTAIVAETARWQPSSSVATLPWDRDQEWVNEWRYLDTTFFPQRTARLLEQIRKHANWWPFAPPAPTVPAGAVPAGTELTFTAPTGTVYYTTDGSDPRLPGGAVQPGAHSTAAGSGTNLLVAAGSVWRFLDDGSDPGPTWMNAGFVDTTWKAGPAEIGYGDGNEATTAGFVDIDPQTPGVQKNYTTYFRRTFDAPNLANLKELTLRLVRDDGAVVYLNGREVWRVNLPDGPITPTTPAVTAVGGTDESTFFEQSLGDAAALLRPTGNVVAVEIHQQVPSSSDISFDLELSAKTQTSRTNSVIVVDRPVLVRARTYSGTDWSALVEAYFVPTGIPVASAANLVLAEIQYHPLDEPDAEFLEFLNTSSTTVDLSDVRLTGAVSFTFPTATLLAAGTRAIVAKDPAIFAARYAVETSPYYRPNLAALGPWLGSLANGGERVGVVAPDGTSILDCEFATTTAWPRRADGLGSTLELIDASNAPTNAADKSLWLGDPRRWRASVNVHGSPGADGSGTTPRVVINEVLSFPTVGEEDAIELVNLEPREVDVSGWFLSDASANYRKFRFPDGTRLAPGEYRVLRESEFNRATHPACLVPFAFDSDGEEALLVEATPAGALLRFVDGIAFGPTPRGVTSGRFPDGTGPWQTLASPSLGAANRSLTGGYDAWVTSAFPPGTPADRTRPDADPDGDGWVNFAEYAFVLSPDRPDPGPLQASLAATGADLLIVYRVRTGATDLSYQVEVTGDLAHWTAAGVAVEEIARSPQADGSTRITARLRSAPTDAGPVSARFVRIIVRSP